MYNLSDIGVYRINNRLVLSAKKISHLLQEYKAPTREFIDKEIAPYRRGLFPKDYKMIALGTKKVHFLFSGYLDDIYQVLAANLFLVDLIYLDANEKYNSNNIRLIGEIHKSLIPDRFCITSDRYVPIEQRLFLYRNIENSYPVDLSFMQFDCPQRGVCLNDPVSHKNYWFIPKAHGDDLIYAQEEDMICS